MSSASVTRAGNQPTDSLLCPATTTELFSKVDVVGESVCETYKHLSGELGNPPSWNFCKYLVDRDGEVVQFFSAKDSFSSIRTSIDYFLSTKHSSDEL